MIRLNVFLTVEEANRPKVLEVAKELTAHSIKEDGCVAYDIFESATRPQVLMFCETWKDEEALANHEKSEVFQKNIVIMKELTQVKIEKFTF
jgi:quinol monooxygenase YgiN